MSPRASCIFQTQIVPRVKSAISSVAHCAGAEVHNELIWDSIARSAKMIATPPSHTKPPQSHCKGIY